MVHYVVLPPCLKKFVTHWLTCAQDALRPEGRAGDWSDARACGQFNNSRVVEV